MSKVAHSIRRGLKEAVAYAEGKADDDLEVEGLIDRLGLGRCRGLFSRLWTHGVSSSVCCGVRPPWRLAAAQGRVPVSRRDTSWLHA